MNILLDLLDVEIQLLRGKLEREDGHPDESEQLLKKFEQGVENGISSLLNWNEIPEDLNDVPDGVTFGKFNNKPWVGATHYYKSIESDK